MITEHIFDQEPIIEKKGLFIKTYGCQMNVYDSQKMEELLIPHGFKSVSSPEDADMIILNTCHIREKAAEKVYSELGVIKILKDTKKKSGKELIVVVAGCVAQAEGEEVVKRSPIVDIVVGPQSYHTIPILLEEIKRKKSWVTNLNFSENEKFDTIQASNTSTTTSPFSAFLTIQEGCDKFCSFCCVPYTRGPEYSRPVIEIYREALMMASRGTKEITLLGQNVSTYRGAIPKSQTQMSDLIEYEFTSDDEYWCIGKLIQCLAKIPSIKRIRYLTSHPVDMTEEKNAALLEAHANEKKLMPYLHLPAQSGSDKILKAMNRKYDSNFYLGIIEKFRAKCNDIAISSDFIVGYPGEKEEDFIKTLELVQKVGYAQHYSFKYSPRPGTPGATLETQIPEHIKEKRLQILQQVLGKQQLSFNQSKIGSVLSVLLERSGKFPGQLLGKSQYLQSVICAGDKSMIGSIVNVKIERAGQNCLHGSIYSS